MNLRICTASLLGLSSMSTGFCSLSSNYHVLALSLRHALVSVGGGCSSVPPKGVHSVLLSPLAVASSLGGDLTFIP